jgi:hypothetical protein
LDSPPVSLSCLPLSLHENVHSPFDFTFTKDGSVFTPENIARYDAFIFYTTGDPTTPGADGNPPMSMGSSAAFLEAIHNGKGFVGIHSASDTFHSPGSEDPVRAARWQGNGDDASTYIKMLGGEFITHGAQQAGRQICVDKTFPGCGAVPADFGPVEEWYSLKNFAPDLHVPAGAGYFGPEQVGWQRARL